jgi:hypothetical protein
MIGEIWELGEVLFRLRAHPQRSMKANKGRRARAAWYNPAGGPKWFVLPDWELMIWELLRSARKARLPWLERRRCEASILVVHYGRRLRTILCRLKGKLKARSGFRTADCKP